MPADTNIYLAYTGEHYMLLNKRVTNVVYCIVLALPKNICQNLLEHAFDFRVVIL